MTPRIDHDATYFDLDDEDTIARVLAADQARLANDRTFLAYTRTSLAFAIGGASVVHFFGGLPADIGGAALIVGAALAAGIGLYRHRTYSKRIAEVSMKPMPAGLGADGRCPCFISCGR